MCGIAGLFDTTTSPTRTDLSTMNDRLTHRGPDDSGIYIDSPVGFAHRRLSIIDPDAQPQPLFNEDDSVCVVFNGEIYNHQELRQSISNHEFETETDTEVLVHLYEEHGPEFVEQLEGMFAFALWDRDRECLFLARDAMGIKPLFLVNDGTAFGFASELPAILDSPLDHGALDTRAISEYFALGFVPAPRTAFENVEKVLPGQLMTISESGIERQRFHNPNISEIQNSISDAANVIREKITEAVEKRMMSDVPLGTFLSGGIDSTIITGLMAEKSDRPVKTFTVGFENERFDESSAARAVAEYHNTDHTEYTVSADDVRELIPKVLTNLGEPFADPSLIPTFVVAQETSNDVKVALSGDGADELFAGYNRYRGEYYSRFYRSVPQSIRSMLIEPVVKRLPASRETELGEAFRKGEKFIRASSEDAALRHFEWVRTIPDDAAIAFQGCNPMVDGKTVIDQEHRVVGTWLPPEHSEPLTRMLTVDTYYGLPDQLLRKVDLASMYNSLEVRVPFLDKQLVEYSLGLPTKYKITGRTRKRVLKHAFKDLLPDKIYTRPKQGFEMPIGEWLKDELHEEFRLTVRSADTELLDREAVLALHDSHVSGHRDYEWFLWNVYVFVHWHARMESEGYLKN
jgi:asparagine synthase (glutamine-hydrolysing)